MVYNALWGVCAEGAGAIKDLCCLHERCSYRLSVGVYRVAASVSLDWECVVVLLSCRGQDGGDVASRPLPRPCECWGGC